MKRFPVGLIVGLIIGLFIGALGVANASAPIKLLINGNYVQCDVPPQNINGRVLVPARFVAEALGATVTWDNINQTVVINREGYIPPAISTPNASDALKQTPVTIEELPVTINIEEPDSIGTVWMNAAYKNNSKKKIVAYRITILLKENNSKVYLDNYDTVLPGETSPSFQTFGPKSQNKNDMEFLKYDITVLNEDGTKTYLTYDTKLKTYKWF